MSENQDYNGPWIRCSYHKEDHPAYEFSGKNRYCRAGLNEYRRKKRVDKQIEVADIVAAGAPICPVCRKNPILRKQAKRCAECVAAKAFRCACGRKAKNTPHCGRCRHKMRKAQAAEKRQAQLARGLTAFTGNAICAKCHQQLLRDPAGNVQVHVCG